ncbi:ACT domain containing protein [Melia azedarach]|uniref:ACT domain containing protein n=1 Tax=Melia azedarach TaxID=155640 RepID=A0ACC1WWE0_MELAZ|nr:ACT domain containing protein [Melia azedarach]
MAFTTTFFSASTSSLSLRGSRFLDSDFSPRFSHNSCIIKFSRRFSELGISTASRKFSELGISIASKKKVLFASSSGMNAVSSTSLDSEPDDDSVPMPVVVIDQDSDSDATILQLSFKDRLGGLFDMMTVLKELGLDVSKGTVNTEGPVKLTKIFVTRLETGRRVEDPDLLEKIRLTITNNLLKYHLESSGQLAMGKGVGTKAPEKKLDVNDIDTFIQIHPDGPKRSLLYVGTADRSGLLVEIIKIIADANIDLESAEIHTTERFVAFDKFVVSRRGAALDSYWAQVIVDLLETYLCRLRMQAAAATYYY